MGLKTYNDIQLITINNIKLCLTKDLRREVNKHMTNLLLQRCHIKCKCEHCKGILNILNWIKYFFNIEVKEK